MSGMDGRAFGSPVAAATVATNACGSVGERIVQGSRIRLFQDARESIQRSTEVRGTGASEDVGNQGEFYSIRRRCGMYTTPSPDTEEGGQLCSAIDFIAYEHHEGGCVPFRK
jgi:hypothetical protein